MLHEEKAGEDKSGNREICTEIQGLCKGPGTYRRKSWSLGYDLENDKSKQGASGIAGRKGIELP